MTERQKGARFEATAVEPRDENEQGECYLILELNHVNVKRLIKQLELCMALPEKEEHKNALWCVYLEGTPKPQVYFGKDGVETGRPPSFLSEEYTTKK